MRKKLFAVIMSAMMMITFMPAMAFAQNMDDTTTTYGWTFDGVGLKDTETTFSKIYDGKDHAVACTVAPLPDINASGVSEGDKFATGVVSYSVFNRTTGANIQKDVATVALKDVANYMVVANLTMVEKAQVGATGVYYWKAIANETDQVFVEITKRSVLVSAKNSTVSILKEKNYDGKGVVIGDADYNITPLWDATKKDYVAANTGLVAGDTLFVKAVETPADAGVYEVTRLSHWTNVNPNYAAKVEDANHTPSDFIGSQHAKSFTVAILKADNAVTLSKTNKTFNIAGKKTTAKKSFKINPKATWGTVKVTKVGGSGYLYLKGNKVVVKKGAKLGTYKLKVKAYVVGNSNYASAEMIKTINVKIK